MKSKALVFLFWLASTFYIIGCKSKENKSKSDNVIETQSIHDQPLYKSEVFTQPGEFPSGIEGPAVDEIGNLYAVNFIKRGTVGKVNADGSASLFLNLPKGSTGNGIRFNSQGEMLIADYTGHNILKVDMKDQAIKVFAHHDKMNQPNDIAISGSDILYLSDPNWENSTGKIWRVDTNGELTLLEDQMGTTNGIEVSPDNTKLYVNESLQRKIWLYDLSPQGSISNKRLLIEFDDFGLDGMRCDSKGNLYVTRHGKGTVVKLSPNGTILKEIKLIGKKPSNITFGGHDGRTAYVTVQDNGNIERFYVEHPGRSIMMNRSRQKYLHVENIQYDGEPDIEMVSRLLEEQVDLESIDVINWDRFDYAPTVKFRIAYYKDEIWLKYYIEETNLLAKETETNSYVSQDSCVEFFFDPFGNGNYYNFEFNCIGTVLAQYRAKDQNERFLPQDLIEDNIEIKSSLGDQPFSEKIGNHIWDMTIVISSDILKYNPGLKLNNLKAKANFYKCGSGTSRRHYLSWNPVLSERPDFHLPQHFGTLIFQE